MIMAYILSRKISKKTPPLWNEGNPYESTVIYDGCSPGRTPHQPPVRYDAHTVRPHSFAHMDAPAHIIDGGKTIDQLFEGIGSNPPFWGKTTLVKFDASDFQACQVDDFRHCKILTISKTQLVDRLLTVTGTTTPPNRLLISASGIPEHEYHGHDPNWILTLSIDAANHLIENKLFTLLGTSWKSVDFQPASSERPIHRTLFRQAVIYECLDLVPVPEGNYFFVGVPLPIEGASESPVCPVLFERDEFGG
jgi:arylformamidase